MKMSTFNKNTAVRIAVSLIAIPVILWAVISGQIPFLIFTLVVGTIAFYEFVRISEKKSAFPQLLMGLAAIIFLQINQYWHLMEFNLAVLIISLALLVRELFRNNGSAILNLGTTVLGIFYIGLFTLTLLQIREYFPVNEQGGYLILSMFASIWICDSSAYFGGLTFGKHRLMERVSPKKSWEGAVFGFGGAILSYYLAHIWILDFLTLRDVVILGVITGIVGQMGDLIESLVKRDANVKDSSALIPGHGGMFDRFDSMLFVSPVVYIYLKLFVNI
ncbi:MAG: phosphatidate cytidylyltransferase [Ignavibacteriales bacterium]